MMKERNEMHDKQGRFITGIFFVIIGLLLLSKQMGLAFIPDWLFTWPSILILVGLYIGVKHKFRNPGWLIPTAIGVIFLLNEKMPDLHLDEYTLPIIFIGIGFVIMTKPRRFPSGMSYQQRRELWKNKWKEAHESEDFQDKFVKEDGEYIEVNSVFGNAKKVILSKDFKGGEINCFLAGAEIDLSHADIQATAVLEINAVFAGVKVTLPPHWLLKTEMTTVFGGIQDKRIIDQTNTDTAKVLVLKGAAVFGGIDIKSF